MSTWRYVLNGERKGPVSDDNLYHLLISGTLMPRSLVWKVGMEDWQAAAEVDALGPMLDSLPPHVPNAPQGGMAGAWRRARRHLGSSIALVLGCLAFVGGLAGVAKGGTEGTLIGASVMILGATAYRSAKKRKLGEVKSTVMRLSF
jgi:GYF domain 2